MHTPGNDQDAEAKRSHRTRRIAVAAALVCVLVTMAGAGTALAWLTAQTSTANRFVAGTAQPTVVEDFADGGALKRDVRVANDQPDNVDVYVRAVVSIAWQDADGAQLWDAPRYGMDYSMTWGTAADSAGGSWRMARDGLYYYTAPLAPGASTTNLIDTCSPTSTSSDRHLVVDIAVQAIQAHPADAVTGAWGAPVLADGLLDVASIPAPAAAAEEGAAS